MPAGNSCDSNSPISGGPLRRESRSPNIIQPYNIRLLASGCAVPPPARVDADLDAGVGSEAKASLEARRTEISNFFVHAHAPYLKKADLALEYFNITERLILDNLVQNSGPGRPGIISRVARELALPGKTEQARRKWLERALNVAGISPDAKSAARQADVARYQSALLEIAKAGGEDDQIRKVEEIVARKRDRAAARKRDRKRRAPGQKCLKAVIRYPADRKEVRAALTTFAERMEVELLPE
jgi:hypothetical protein